MARVPSTTTPPAGAARPGPPLTPKGAPWVRPPGRASGREGGGARASGRECARPPLPRALSPRTPGTERHGHVFGAERIT